MKPHIEHPELRKEYFTEEHCHILESWNSNEDPHMSIARARVTPGITTRRHRLRGVQERYLIISGIAEVIIGELPATQVSAGDVVIIPPDTAQSIHNIGQQDVLFYAICTPRFTQACYEDIELD